MTLQSDAIFEFIIQKVKEDPAKAKSVNGVFLYNITKDGKVSKQWSEYILLLFDLFFKNLKCTVVYLWTFSRYFIFIHILM